MWLLSLIASLLAAGTSQSSGVDPSVAVKEATCGRIEDLPQPTYVPPPGSVETGTPLRQTHNLFRAFADGEGVLAGATTKKVDELLIQPWIDLRRLPWRLNEQRGDFARLVAWRVRTEAGSGVDRERESMLGLVLRPGDTWCSPKVTLESGARLKFEAASIETAGDGRLEISWDVGERSEPVSSSSPPHPGSFSAETQIDLSLKAGTGRVCFEAKEGAVAVGEPRLLAPEPPGEDSRPRWVILTIVDALRADVLEGKDAERVGPTLSSLARGGHHYRTAISPGCHTRAAIYPLMMGRDLMRIDPLKRRQYLPVSSPLSRVYSRGNLFLTHLAEDVGYHSVFLGNNQYFSSVPAFSRYSSHGKTTTGTVDAVRKLPDLFQRYADERVMLVYYVTTPHAQSATPRRLVEELGCFELSGAEQCRCMYEARVRHADESLAALEAGLARHNLADLSLRVVTADHGEAIKDGMALEAEMLSFRDQVKTGFWTPLDRGHGNTCHWKEIHVPMVLFGKGLEPASWQEPVSTLDIVPTLRKIMDLPLVSRIDGKELPLTGSSRGAAGAPSSDRSFVSYGFCTDSHIRRDQQLIWWVEDCRVRKAGGGELIDYRSELWAGGSRVATDRSSPGLLRGPMGDHESWIRARVAADAVVLDLADLPPGALSLTTDGTITDYGPSSTVHGLTGIRDVHLDDEARTLKLTFDGYRGLYYVATSPPLAPIRIDVELPPGSPQPMSFVGPLQLPLDLLGRTITPAEHAKFFIAEGVPTRRASKRPSIRFWWQPYESMPEAPDPQTLSDFARVLREWGYIR